MSKVTISQLLDLNFRRKLQLMENINIEKTDSSPKITLDYENGLIEINGKCYPENAFDFFEPVINWIKHYFNDNNQVKSELDQQYEKMMDSRQNDPISKGIQRI